MDLLDAQKVQNKLEKHIPNYVTECILVHAVGRFKFEEMPPNEPDTDIIQSNYNTLLHVISPLRERFNALTICAFGSVSDKYAPKFWQSYTHSKNMIREKLAEISKEGNAKCVMVNVSTVDTGNENKLRPNADKTHWLVVQSIVEDSLNAIVSPHEDYTEIDVYEKVEGFNPEEYYTNENKLLEKWKREMGR